MSNFVIKLASDNGFKKVYQLSNPGKDFVVRALERFKVECPGEVARFIVCLKK